MWNASMLAAQSKLAFNQGNVFNGCSFNKEPICWLSYSPSAGFNGVQDGGFGVRVLGHGGLLRFGGLRLRCVAALQAVVAEQVIGRRLAGLDDEDALGRQRGEHRQRVHVHWDPGQRQEVGQRRETRVLAGALGRFG